MRPYAFAGAAGLLCIPVTYGLTRQGDLIVVAVVTIMIGAAGGGAAASTTPLGRRVSIVAIGAAFCAGAAAGR